MRLFFLCTLCLFCNICVGSEYKNNSGTGYICGSGTGSGIIRVKVSSFDPTGSIEFRIQKTSSGCGSGGTFQQNGTIHIKEGPSSTSGIPSLGTTLCSESYSIGASSVYVNCNINFSSPDKKYYYAVIYSGSNTYWAGPIEIERRLDIPNIYDPNNGNTHYENPIDLDWSSVSGADNYRVQVSTYNSWDEENGFSSTVLNQATGNLSEHPWTGSAAGSIYYMSVRAGSSTLYHSRYSQPIMFRTRLAIPTLNYPTNYASISGDSINFNWSSVSNASNYRIQISASSNLDLEIGFNSPTINQSTTTNSFLWSSIPPGTYYWSVRGGSSTYYHSKYANVYSFTIQSSNNLVVTPSTQSVNVASGNTPFSVSSNVAWTAVSNSSWLTLSPSSGNNNGTITASFTLNASPTTNTSSRTATITVSGGSMTEYVSVTQSGNTLPSISNLQANHNTSTNVINASTDIADVNGDQIKNIRFFFRRTGNAWGGFDYYDYDYTGTLYNTGNFPISFDPSQYLSNVFDQSGTYEVKTEAYDEHGGQANYGTVPISSFSYTHPSNPQLSVNPLSLNFLSSGNILNVSLTSNANWWGTASTSWVTLLTGAGIPGSYNVLISCSPNTTGATRTATINFDNGSVSQLVTVTQDGTSVSSCPSFYQDPHCYFEEAANHYSIPSNILKAIAHVESDWDPSWNNNNTRGIMGIYANTLQLTFNSSTQYGFNALAHALKEGYTEGIYSYASFSDYQNESINTIVNWIQNDATDIGIQANIRAASFMLQYFADTRNLIHSNEDRQYLESWWFAVSQYGNSITYTNTNGKQDVMESNYVYRVYNWLMKGYFDNNLNTDRFPSIKITLPPHFTFKYNTTGKVLKYNGILQDLNGDLVTDNNDYIDHLMRLDDRMLIPHPEYLPGDNLHIPFIRNTIPFRSDLHLGTVHTNSGTGQTITVEHFKLDFPLFNLTPYTADINSVFDYFDPDYSISSTGQFSLAYTGEYSRAAFGALAPNVCTCYMKKNGADFNINGHYTATDEFPETYLVYDGHPAYDYRTKDFVLAHKWQYATAKGVFRIGSDPAYSAMNEYVIEHWGNNNLLNGYTTHYLHCDWNSHQFSAGDIVQAGNTIGLSGAVGVEPAEHAHIEVRYNGHRIDPYGWQYNLDNSWTRAAYSELWSGQSANLLLNPSNYQYSMNFIGQLDSNWPGKSTTTVDTVDVFAFVNGQLRGVMYSMEFDSIFEMKIYSNSTAKETFTFVTQIGAKVYNMQNFNVFDNNDTLGSFLNPETIYFSVDTLTLNIHQDRDTYIIKVFPNPNDGTIYIDYKLPDNAVYHLHIYDILGKTVYSGELIELINKIQINLSSNPSGLYLLRITGDNNFHITEQILKY